MRKLRDIILPKHPEIRKWVFKYVNVPAVFLSDV